MRTKNSSVVLALVVLLACDAEQPHEPSRPGPSPTVETSDQNPGDRCATFPPPLEATYLPRGFSDRLRKGAGLFKGTDYPTEGLVGHYVGPRETIHINFQVEGGPLPYEPANEHPIRVLGSKGTIGSIEGGFALSFSLKRCDFRMDTYGVGRRDTIRVARGLVAWPKGPFAHNCVPENAFAEGDFDGDGNLDRVDFYPGYANDAGFVGWVLRQRYGNQRAVSTPVDAECPEPIGATDVDQDGGDELFFDTGKGMTAALVDLLVYDRGKLREVAYNPKKTLLYVGGTNASASDISCYPTNAGSVLEVLEVVTNKRATATTFALDGRMLGKVGTYPVRGNASGRLRCFGLRWNGY